MSSTPSPSRSRIAYWMFNYTPKWEAASQEVATLASAFRHSFGTQINAMNFRGQRLKLTGPDRIFPMPYSVAALPLLSYLAKRSRINHVFASPADWLLTPRLARLDNTILTIAKDNSSLDVLEANIEVLKSLRYIVVESERHRDLFMQVGVPEGKVKLIYPGIEPSPYRPASEPFTILFATSPFGGKGMLSRGVFLMLAVAKLLPDVRFRLIWRDKPDAVNKLLEGNGTKNVEVVAGFIDDMAEVYDTTHATILPALRVDSLKPCPHSGVRALAHGKPILASTCASLSGVVEKEECGVVFEPTVHSLRAAIVRLIDNYDHYQQRAHPVAQRKFSPASFLSRYQQLYSGILNELPEQTFRDAQGDRNPPHSGINCSRV